MHLNIWYFPRGIYLLQKIVLIALPWDTPPGHRKYITDEGPAIQYV